MSIPASSLYSQSPAVTFVLRDAGETKALAPVMQNLDNQGVNYSIVAEGTASQLVANNPHFVPSQSEINKTSSINPGLAAFWQQKMNQATQAPSCVTGLVSGFQKQWADFFKQSGRRVIGYYDGFGINTNNQDMVNAFAGSLTDLITPTTDIANYYRQNGFSNIPVVALGQPVLETTAQAVQQTNAPALAQQLNIDTQKPTLLWVGQYGADYEQAFALFCQTIRQFSNANVLISLHPKSDGALENKLLQQFGLQQHVKIIPKSITTNQALSIADTVLSHNSTMSIQAYLQGKNVVLVGKNDQVFDPLTNYRLTPRCETPFALANQLNQPPAANTQAASGNRYQLLGIPAQAIQNITQYIINTIQGFGWGQRAA